MDVLNSLGEFDRYLAGLKLTREEHTVIQLHLQKIRQGLANESGSARVE